MIEVREGQHSSAAPIFLAGLALGAITAIILGNDEAKKMVEKVAHKIEDSLEEFIDEKRLEAEKEAERQAEPITFRTPQNPWSQN